MYSNHFKPSLPEPTAADMAELKKQLDKLNDRLAQKFAELVQSGQIEVESTPAVADEPAPSAPRADDEINVDGLVLVMKSVQGTRGQFGNGEITGTVINRRDHKLSYAQVSFNLYDASDAQVGSAMANINGLEPGGSWKFAASGFGKDFATYKFSELSGF